MDSPHGPPPAGAATPPSAGATAVTQALHVVLKNLAIYPSSHPRVTAAAAAFVTTLREHNPNAARVTIQASGDQLLVAGSPAADALRLPLRFRDAGLRGVVFAPDLGDDDLLTFANALNRARARNGNDFFRLWTTPNPRIEPLPLVFAGVHSSDAPAQPWQHDGATADTKATGAGMRGGRRRGVHGVVDQLIESEAVQAHLRAIELHACDPGDVDERELDLLTAIADLLPADVSGNPEEVASAVTSVLARVEQSLAELVRRNARVQGGELLRTALEIARKYFHTDAPTVAPKAELPSGRPEDARIVADLGMLLQEFGQLPDAHALCLPRAEDLGEASSTVAQRMCGIVLHALAGSASPAIVTAALPRLRNTVPRILCDLLDIYLGTPAAESPVATAGIVRILDALLAAGRGDLVRERGYVDARFLVRAFPDSLPLAARVLGGDTTSRRALREALSGLVPVLQMGGAAAAVRAGVLQQPVVVAALVAVGGDIAQQLLQSALANTSPGERQALLECARSLVLPQAEAAALRAVASADQLPPDYLPLLFSAAARGDYTGPCRAASGTVLRDAVLRLHAQGRHLDRLRAIEALLLVPSIETRTLLDELAKAGRFTRLGSESRELRQCARRTLEAMTQRLLR
ncbi:MAG: hypothetical protein JNL08_21100 [Planctomycetes bacterium]|nr:hypothetical protein [Planctomycetota bacterium]